MDNELIFLGIDCSSAVSSAGNSITPPRLLPLYTVMFGHDSDTWAFLTYVPFHARHMNMAGLLRGDSGTGRISPTLYLVASDHATECLINDLSCCYRSGIN
jgi:hypothetical protein